MTKTFEEFDKYGLKPFADKLTNYLRVESEFVEESFVLSLNSEFGSGESTFFEMWSNELVSAGNTLNIVRINAWESDFQGDPLLAIISSLLSLDSRIRTVLWLPLKGVDLSRILWSKFKSLIIWGRSR